VDTEAATAIYFHSADTDFVERLANDLRDAHMDVQLVSSMVDKDPQKVGAILDRHGHLMIVLSATALEDGWWVRHFRAFQEAQKPVSIIRADGTPLPAALNEMNWVDFDIGYRVGFNGLMLSLRTPTVPSAAIDLSFADPATMQAIEQRMQRGTLAAIGLYMLGTIVLLLLL
jgi:hypothetical protein